jgi:hypothetical protein
MPKKKKGKVFKSETGRIETLADMLEYLRAAGWTPEQIYVGPINYKAEYQTITTWEGEQRVIRTA